MSQTSNARTQMTSEELTSLIVQLGTAEYQLRYSFNLLDPRIRTLQEAQHVLRWMLDGLADPSVTQEPQVPPLEMMENIP